MFHRLRLPDLDAAPGHQRTLAIGCFASICRDRLGDALVGFTDAHPEVAVGIHEMRRRQLLQALGAGEVALAIVPGTPDPQFADAALWEDEVLAVLPAGHPLAAHARIAPAALAGEPFLVSRHQHGWDMHRFLADRVLGGGGAVSSVLLDLGPKRLLAAVGRGEGVALIGRSHAGLAGADVALRPLAAPGARFAVHAQWRRDDGDPLLPPLRAALAG
jgi:DNA-binding transcriptional LysR family regulator